MILNSQLNWKNEVAIKIETMTPKPIADNIIPIELGTTAFRGKMKSEQIDELKDRIKDLEEKDTEE